MPNMHWTCIMKSATILFDSFASLLCDLEESSMSSSHRHFHGVRHSPLYHVVLHGNEICIKKLCASPINIIRTISLQSIVHVSSIIGGRTRSAGL